MYCQKFLKIPASSIFVWVQWSGIQKGYWSQGGRIGATSPSAPSSSCTALRASRFSLPSSGLLFSSFPSGVLVSNLVVFSLLPLTSICCSINKGESKEKRKEITEKRENKLHLLWEMGPCYIFLAGLKLKVLLPQPPKCYYKTGEHSRTQQKRHFIM